MFEAPFSKSEAYASDVSMPMFHNVLVMPLMRPPHGILKSFSQYDPFMINAWKRTQTYIPPHKFKVFGNHSHFDRRTCDV